MEATAPYATLPTINGYKLLLCIYLARNTYNTYLLQSLNNLPNITQSNQIL